LEFLGFSTKPSPLSILLPALRVQLPQGRQFFCVRETDENRERIPIPRKAGIEIDSFCSGNRFLEHFNRL
jgi:hypothetical protein